MADSPCTQPPRLPSFAPVPLKHRADGWTAVRQAQFIGKLAETGSVSAEAGFAGVARETAYRLRGKPGAEEFARAWDAALAIAGRRSAPGQAEEPGDDGATPSPAKVTDEDLVRRMLAGRLRPVLRAGKFVGCVHKSQNSALLQHLAGRERGAGRAREAQLRARRANFISSGGCRPGCG